MILSELKNTSFIHSVRCRCCLLLWNESVSIDDWMQRSLTHYNNTMSSSPQGQTIGKANKPWTIGRLLGSGACGSVHELLPPPSYSPKSMQYAIKCVTLPPISTKAAANKKRKKTVAERNADLLLHEYTILQNAGLDRGRLFPEIPLMGVGGPPAYGETADKSEFLFDNCILDHFSININLSVCVYCFVFHLSLFHLLTATTINIIIYVCCDQQNSVISSWNEWQPPSTKSFHSSSNPTAPPRQIPPSKFHWETLPRHCSIVSMRCICRIIYFRMSSPITSCWHTQPVPVLIMVVVANGPIVWRTIYASLTLV